MKMRSTSNPHTFRNAISSALDTIKRAYGATVEGIAEARRMRRAYDELSAMSNHALEDIGVSRGDIPAIVAGTYRSDRSAWPRAGNVVHIGRRQGPRPRVVQTQLGGRRSKQVADQAQPTGVDVVDVRSLIPAQRHAKIFELVNQLGPGASFVLVNDHDPKPLYYQLEAEYPKQFSWTYIERGPDVWRVQIGKLAQAA
jgi:uncharacterized protein (DUF2249 family)/uncharacterized protein YjiS (DUF1127 family)